MNLKTITTSMLAVTLSLGVAHAKTAPTTITLNTGGSTLAGPTYTLEYEAYTKKYKTVLWNYEGVGSGSGQNAFLQNNIALFENLPAGTETYGTIVGTQVDIGASDAFLSASQLTNPSTGSYGTSTEGSAVDGPVIQVPTFGTPITVAFNESGITGNALTLTDAQVCGIFSGQITDWNQIDSSIPSGTTINVFVRSDSSGTTFLLTQHLHAVCTSSNSSFPSYPVPVTKYFYDSSSSASNYIFTTLPANFTGESGSGGVATNMLSTANSLGYLSPDYTDIAPKPPKSYALEVAALVNATDGKAYLPTEKNAETGLESPGAGALYGAPPTGANAADPLFWVPQIPVTKKGYPIVGYTTMLVSSCYHDPNAGTAVATLLKDTYTSDKKYVEDSGFAPLADTAASKYVAAVEDTFLTNKSGDNLDIDDATVCPSYTGR